MRTVQGGLTCRNCGAPVTSEICPYCGSPTGLDTGQADMEYPTLECKEANLGFWTIAFPLIFGFGFGFGGIMPIAIALTGAAEDPSQNGLFILFSLPFLAISIAAFVIALLPVFRYIKLKRHGKHIEAIVYGYTDDNVLMNGRPAQVVKLLVESPAGKRFIMYQLGSTQQPYGVNTTVGVIVYKNMFMIEKKKEELQW